MMPSIIHRLGKKKEGHKLWWKGGDQNYNAFHETVFDAIDPAFTYHFTNNILGDTPILSFVYSLFE